MSTTPCHKRGLMVVLALLVVGCSSAGPSSSASVGPSATPVPTATLPAVTPSPVPTASPTLVPTPEPTPTLGSRKSIVKATHPKVSLKSAVAALDADGLSVAQPPGEANPQLDWCKNPQLANAMPRDGLDYCEDVAMRLYLAYVSTGNDKYFNQALGFFNYVWNWTERPGLTYDQQATHSNMMLLLTDACRQEFPEYGDAIP